MELQSGEWTILTVTGPPYIVLRTVVATMLPRNFRLRGSSMDGQSLKLSESLTFGNYILTKFYIHVSVISGECWI